MNEVLKQRLVGALVILALAVVLWPVIFVEPSVPPVDRASQVPAMPSLKEMQIASPQPLEGMKPPPEREPELHLVPPGALDNTAPGETGTDTAAAAEVAAQMPEDRVEESALEPEQEPEPARPVVGELDDQGIPIAWSLQVATLSNRDKAQALARELVALDYKAYLRVHHKDDKTLHKVYIGPNFDQEVLLRVKPDIDSKFKVNSIVSRYVP